MLRVLNPNAASSASTPTYPACISPRHLSQTNDPRCQHIFELPSPGDSAGLARWQEMKLHLLHARSHEVGWQKPLPPPQHVVLAAARAMLPGLAACACSCSPQEGAGPCCCPLPSPAERRAGLYLVISTTSSRNARAESRFVFSSSEAEQVLPLVCDSPAPITLCSPTRERGPKPPPLVAGSARAVPQSCQPQYGGSSSHLQGLLLTRASPHAPQSPHHARHLPTPPQAPWASREWAHRGCMGISSHVSQQQICQKVR